MLKVNRLAARNLIIASAVFIWTGCIKVPPGVSNPPSRARQNEAAIVFTNNAGYHVYNGGFSSAIAAHPANPDLFYLMTDRGPNVDGYGGKVFPVPDFNPQIGLFKLKGDKLEKFNVIHFKAPDGQFITGRPNPEGIGGTGEIPYTVSGNLLPLDPNGLDPEGLVALKDGSFWVSDEYGPHLAHFNASGKQVERISPFNNGTGNRTIPKVFTNRRANRGMEGLTITPDGQWLVGMMQSPLDNPRTPAIRTSKTLRILFFNIKTGATKQYLYQTEHNGNLVSEIAAAGNSSFYILERDGEFPTPAFKAFKKVFKINITGATDVTDPADAPLGRLYNGRTIEQLSDNLVSADIVPVSKILTLDILTAFPDYPHDKAEGISLVGNFLAISNDDDFGIIDNGAGDYMPKYLPFFPENVIDKGAVYFINLSTIN